MAFPLILFNDFSPIIRRVAITAGVNGPTLAFFPIVIVPAFCWLQTEQVAGDDDFANIPCAPVLATKVVVGFISQMKSRCSVL